jgi:hypothetical protein
VMRRSAVPPAGHRPGRPPPPRPAATAGRHPRPATATVGRLQRSHVGRFCPGAGDLPVSLRA